MKMSVRLIARLCELAPSAKPRQFRGLPPELTDGSDERQPLPWLGSS